MALIKFNSEQKLIQNEVRKFVLQEIEPISSDIEKNGKIPEEIFKKLAELGFLYPIIPIEPGGAGLDSTSLCIIIEELSRACGSLGFIIAVNNGLVGFALNKYGKEKFKTYSSRLTSGEIAGFDYETGIQNDIKILQGNPLKITGKKRFMLNADMASFVLLNINTENRDALFILDNLKEKTKISKPYLLGMKSAGIADVVFDHIEIPEDFCLIQGADYSQVISQIREYFCFCLSAVCLGIAEAGLEASIKYAKERKQFNKPICEFPMVQEMIAEMKIKIEATRNLIYDAASRFDNGEECGLACSITQATATEAAVYCGIKSVQIFGGYGYTKDYPVERYLRDAKSIQVLSGLPSKLREKIAQELLI